MSIVGSHKRIKSDVLLDLYMSSSLFSVGSSILYFYSEERLFTKCHSHYCNSHSVNKAKVKFKQKQSTSGL